MTRLHYNALKTGSAGSGVPLSLGTSLTSSGTSITLNAALTHSNGTAAPTIASPDYLPLEILDASGNLTEIVYLTAYTAGATTGTISRGQEGTSGVAHSSGDKVIHGPTVADVTANRDRRWMLGSGELIIDEFNDDALDAAWTRVDGTGAPSTNVTWTEGADVLSLVRNAADTGNTFQGLVHPIGTAPATGDAWVSCLTLFGPPLTNSVIGGLIISDGTTHGAGKQVLGEVISDSTATRQASYVVACSNWSGTGGTLGTSRINPPLGSKMFLRLVYKGSSQWRLDTSSDGVSWVPGASLVTQASFTPSHVGLYSRDAGSGVISTASYEFLRRVSGVS